MLRKGFYYLTHWHVWHWFIKYIFLGPVWLWLCYKSRSAWFFTPSNPGISFGGFLGETKREIYQSLPPGSYPKSVYISPSDKFLDVKDQVVSGGFLFPFIVKPDVGQMGLMFRRIESLDQLRQYHAVMPVDYIIQELAEYPLEVSVFYYRYPGEAKGTISGLARKEMMSVTGDGKSTLKQLILNYPRAQFRLQELFGKHKNHLDKIIRSGESFILSDALNLSRGGRIVSMENEIDDQLTSVFDKFSRQGNFLYGRYDIKCKSIEDLRQGKNFTILEYNGCGGEPHHVYGNGSSFLPACWTLAKHMRILFEISKRVRDLNGARLWSYAEGSEYLRKVNVHFTQLKKLDHSFVFRTEQEKSIARTIHPVELKQTVAA